MYDLELTTYSPGINSVPLEEVHHRDNFQGCLTQIQVHHQAIPFQDN